MATSRSSSTFWQAQPEYAADLDQPLHAADGRAVDGAAHAGRPCARHCRDEPAAHAVSRSSRCWTACSMSTPSRRQSPEECIFAQTTECFSSDLERRITPCQFGGKPDCANCGCIASAGLEAIGRHRLRGGVPVGEIFYASLAVGRPSEESARRWPRSQNRPRPGQPEQAQ